MSQKILTLLLFITVVKCGTAVKCYHCYDLYNGTGITLASSTFGGDFIKCGKKQVDWNSWDCPSDWPSCIVMSLTSKTSHEVVRTCAVENFCSLYVPLEGAKMETCRECKTALCNGDVGFPLVPENSGPLFVFNINLHINKYSLKNKDS